MDSQCSASCLLCTVSFSAFQKVSLTRINLKSQQVWGTFASARYLKSQSHNLGSGLTLELQSRAMATKLHSSLEKQHFQTISSLHGVREPWALQNLQEGEGCHHQVPALLELMTQWAVVSYCMSTFASKQCHSAPSGVFLAPLESWRKNVFA